MSVKSVCVIFIFELLLFPLHESHQFANQSAELHQYWIPNEDDLMGYVVNKKKRSAKESRFLKFDYLSQNINVS